MPVGKFRNNSLRIEPEFARSALAGRDPRPGPVFGRLETPGPGHGDFRRLVASAGCNCFFSPELLLILTPCLRCPCSWCSSFQRLSSRLRVSFLGSLIFSRASLFIVVFYLKLFRDTGILCLCNCVWLKAVFGFLLNAV